MKKMIMMMVAVIAALTSCKSDDPIVKNPTPKVSFTDTNFEIPKGCTQRIMVLLETPVAEETKIPVTVETSAVGGVDYTLDNDYFIIAAGEKEGYLSMSIPFDITEAKEIVIKLGQLPAGYEGGRFTSVKVKSSLTTVSIFSFKVAKDNLLGSNMIVEVNLKDQKGANIKAPVETNLAVTASSSSTAVLGVHYRFKDGKNFATIKKNGFRGNVIVEFIKYEEGKNKIVLSCGETNGYFDGTNPTCAILIAPELTKNIVGEWKGYDFYNFDAYFASYSGADAIKNLIPVPAPSDIIKFTADGKIEVAMTSLLKDFFRNGEWKVTSEVDAMRMTLNANSEIMYAPVVEFSKVNYNFTSKSELIQPGNISVFILKDKEGKEILHIRVAYDDYDNEKLEMYPTISYADLDFRFVRK